MKHRFVPCASLFVALLMTASWAQQKSASPPADLANTTDAQPAPEDRAPAYTAASPDGFDPFSSYAASSVMTHRKNRVQPSVLFVQTMDTNSLGTTAESSSSQSFLLAQGSLALTHQWKSSDLALQYTSGIRIYGDRSQPNSTFQIFDVQQTFVKQKWSLQIADEFSYTPESTYGSSALFGLGTLSSSSAVSPGTAPSQTIPTSSGVISQTVATEVERHSSGRSSLSFAASYGLLHFTQSGFLDSNEKRFGASYSYDFDRRNLLTLSYGFSQFGLLDEAGTNHINVHSATAFYRRQVSRRLSVGASGGPQIARSNPALGQSTSFYGSGWIRYGLRKTEVVTSYFHGITGGSGILQGAITDSAQVSIGREAVRRWRGLLSLGYARNKSLQSASQPASGQFNSGFVNLELNRSVGSSLWLFLLYNLNPSSVQCNLSDCGNQWHNIFGVGVRWQRQPIPISLATHSGRYNDA